MEKVFATHISGKELVPSIYKELLKEDLLENGQKIRIDVFPKKMYKWLITHEKMLNITYY